MPLPKPSDFNSEDDFHSACMEFLVGEEDYETDQANAVCYRLWREKKSADSLIHKSGIVKAGRPDDLRATFIASTNTVDRMGDIVEQDWILDDFKANPVLMFSHRTGDLPVGKVTNIEVKDNQLIAETRGLPEGLDEFADKVWKMIKAGFLNAVSVGFLPGKSEPMFDESTGEFKGYRYSGNRLTELSVVPVPANQQALAIARSLHFSDRDIERVFDSREQRETPRAAAARHLADHIRWRASLKSRIGR